MLCALLAAQLKSEAMRCSLVAAIAAVAAGTERDQTASGPRPLLSLQPDPAVLRALAGDVAEREWGISGAIVLESGAW